MKELLQKLQRIDLTSKNLVLLDTCFLIDALKHHKGYELLNLMRRHSVCITSFNAEELEHVAHHQDHELKTELRKFLKVAPLKILAPHPFL